MESSPGSFWVVEVGFWIATYMITPERVSSGDSAISEDCILINLNVLEAFCDPLWMVSILLYVFLDYQVMCLSTYLLASVGEMVDPSFNICGFANSLSSSLLPFSLLIIYIYGGVSFICLAWSECLQIYYLWINHWGKALQKASTYSVWWNSN